jgi:hypothetical protein
MHSVKFRCFVGGYRDVRQLFNCDMLSRISEMLEILEANKFSWSSSVHLDVRVLMSYSFGKQE